MPVSRTERRTRAQVAAMIPETPSPAFEPRVSFGIARVSATSQKWYAFKCVDGVVTHLTPEREGKMLGENKPNATGRLKRALMFFLGGVDA